MKIETEIWKPVFMGYYEASSLGRVRSMPKGFVLKGSPNKRGYLRINIYYGGGRSNWNIHRIVALAFLGPIPDGMQVNHKDFNKTNNAVSNLEYVSSAENVAHAKKNMRYWSGSRGYGSKLSDSDAEKIRALRASGVSTDSLARKYSVNPTTIRRVVAGTSYPYAALAKLKTLAPAPEKL